MTSLALMSKEETRKDAKMEVTVRCAELMPTGKPNFKEIPQYPTIAQLVPIHGVGNMLKVLQMMVMDFCRSMNVVRNMNEDQMIEAAAFLLDECGTFRVEDYLMMFTMAKRGQLGKIFDRVDIQVIGSILDAYWLYRDAEGKRIQEEEVKAAERLLDAKNDENTEALVYDMTLLLKEIPDEPEKEISRSDVEAYAKLHNLNWEEIVKQFSKK